MKKEKFIEIVIQLDQVRYELRSFDLEEEDGLKDALGELIYVIFPEEYNEEFPTTKLKTII